MSILAWSFGRWLRCSLVADHCGYAPRSRLASGQNPRAIIAQVISSRVLTFDQLSRCLFHRPCAAPRWWPKQAGPFLLGFGHERGAAAAPGLGQVWRMPREPLLAKGVFLPLDDLNPDDTDDTDGLDSVNMNPARVRRFPSVSSEASM